MVVPKCSVISRGFPAILDGPPLIPMDIYICTRIPTDFHTILSTHVFPTIFLICVSEGFRVALPMLGGPAISPCFFAGVPHTHL
jgi:hypothetical protein